MPRTGLLLWGLFACSDGAAVGDSGLTNPAGLWTGELSAADASIVVDGSAELGTAGAAHLDVDGDGLDDVVATMPNWDSIALMRGPGDGELEVVGFDSAGIWGKDASAEGDLTGDGLDDVAVGNRIDVGGDGPPEVAFVTGEPWGDFTWSVTHDRAGQLARSQTLDYAVLAAGDVDGDGLSDLVVGLDAAGPPTSAGTIWVFPGPISGVAELDRDAAWTLVAAEDRKSFGARLSSAGDLDGDGRSSFVVTSIDGLHLVDDDDRGSVNPPDALLAGWDSDHGDFDGDGLQDLVVTAEAVDETGADVYAAYLLPGPVSEDTSLDDATASVVGEVEEDLWVILVSSAGDLDHDGVEDLAVAAPGSNWSTPGGVVGVIYGPIAGTRTLDDLDARITGEEDGDKLGFVLGDGGDINGDGLDDLFIAAPSHGFDDDDPDDDDGGGAFYLFFGVDGRR